MKLHEARLSLFVNEAKSVNAKSFHHAEARGIARSDITHMIMCIDSGISEMKSQKVSWAEAACGISLCGSGFTAWIKIGKLDRVLNKEDRHVVADQIEIPFLRIELNGESAHIARQISGTARTRDSRETNKDRRLD